MTPLPPAAHTWIDNIAELFAISDGKFSDLRSYKQAEMKDLPPIITPAQTPCVVHYIIDCQPEYSAGGPTNLFWTGTSEFHLTKGVAPANHSDLLLFFPRILVAAMSSVQLSGTVNLFQIPEESAAMRFVTFTDANNMATHQGISVRWFVKQAVTGSYTISA